MPFNIVISKTPDAQGYPVSHHILGNIGYIVKDNENKIYFAVIVGCRLSFDDIQDILKSMSLRSFKFEKDGAYEVSKLRTGKVSRKDLYSRLKRSKKEVVA